MKKLTALSVLLSLTALILLPATVSGKYDVSKPVVVADGGPMPLPPRPPNVNVLGTDGGPMPLPPNPSTEMPA